MKPENIEISITYNNKEDYKHIMMDYIIDFILKNTERSTTKGNHEKYL